jgi:hypothetical protein
VQRNQTLSDYYGARRAVDNNNRIRQGSAGCIERAWAPKNWQIRHLAFLSALRGECSVAAQFLRCSPQ